MVWEASPEDWNWILARQPPGRRQRPPQLRPRAPGTEEAHVVNTASVAGLVAGVLGSYSVTKQAVVGLSESLHLSLAMRGADQACRCSALAGSGPGSTTPPATGRPAPGPRAR